MVDTRVEESWQEKIWSPSKRSSVIEIFKPPYDMRTLHQVIFARLSIEEVSLEP